jgi:polygalacturonase
MDPFDQSRRSLMTAAWFGTAAGLGLSAREASAERGPAPSGAASVFEVTRYGAVADGRTAATEAFQRAIDACAAAGGGTVLVPPGRYVIGAVFLRSHVHLHLSRGATLLGSERPADYPPIKGREEGVDRQVHASMLTGQEIEDVVITGSGTIDGRGGAFWWKADDQAWKMRVAAKLPRGAPYPAGAPLKYPRPRTICLVRCRNVVVEGLTLVDGPGVNIHLLYCQDVVIDRLTVYQNQPVRSSEAVIIDSTQRVAITRCRISAGADGIGIKSGYNEEGRKIGIPVEDVLIDGCHLFRVSSAVMVGSETAGGIRNVLITNSLISDCMSAIRIRAPRGRGGVVEKIRLCNVVIDRVDEVVVKISNFFDSIRGEGRGGRLNLSRSNVELARSRKEPIDEGTPTFRNFTFNRLTVGKAKGLALVEGLPERFIQGVTFQEISLAEAPSGVFCTMAADVSIDGVTLGVLQDPAVDAREVQRLEVHRLRCRQPPPDAPVVWLENVARAFIHGCDIAPGKATTPWFDQEQSRDVTLAANNAPELPLKRPAGG